jgi:hypothetical protein
VYVRLKEQAGWITDSEDGYRILGKYESLISKRE